LNSYAIDAKAFLPAGEALAFGDMFVLLLLPNPADAAVPKHFVRRLGREHLQPVADIRAVARNGFKPVPHDLRTLIPFE
jgi:hypothetical protein